MYSDPFILTVNEKRYAYKTVEITTGMAMKIILSIGRLTNRAVYKKKIIDQDANIIPQTKYPNNIVPMYFCTPMDSIMLLISPNL